MNENVADSAVAEAYKAAKKNNRSNLIFFAIIVVAVFLFSMTNGSGSVVAECDDQLLGVAADQENSAFIYFTDMISVEYRESFDFGTKIEGLDEENVNVGYYENEEFGRYQSLCYVNVEEVVVVKHADGVLVFNCKSTKLTEERYEVIMEKLGLEP